MFHNINHSDCDKYNPDNIFKRFKVIEFPVTFVGLSYTKVLDVEVDLTISAYLKTMHNHRLLKFQDARAVSASHRAFNIAPVDNHTISINFSPRNEYISKDKQRKQFDNRFVIDLRLVQVDGTRCCNNELHAEIGRYYISGVFAYCIIIKEPCLLDFGNVLLNTKITKYIQLNNNSSVDVKMKYLRVTGFEVIPQKFIIAPNSTKRLSVTIKPTSLLVNRKISFEIRNIRDFIDEVNVDDDNFLLYSIDLEAKVSCHTIYRNLTVESLHKLYELNPQYTHLNEELNTHFNRKKMARHYLELARLAHKRKNIVKRILTGKDKCQMEQSITLEENNTKSHLCTITTKKISIFGLFEVLFLPFSIDFGRVGLSTHGENELTIKNNSKYDIAIKLLTDDCVLYTSAKTSSLCLKLKAKAEVNIKIFCWGCIEGNFQGTFEYTIDEKYHRKHPYRLQVGNPTLMVLEKSLKFGMVSTDSFITSVPVRIYNNFNVDVNFKWDEITVDTPFEIIPTTGVVPKQMCKICDVIYVCKSTKAKTHEIDLITESKVQKIIPLELSIITRKLSIKFLQPAVMFKDIALNIETIEKVKLENSSREVALFHVMEPLIPGLRIQPMHGTIKPKMIIIFEIIVKISCVLEFSFDINVKINSKENIILPISGNVVEPKLIIHPKHLYITRIPCNMITYVSVTFQNISTLKSFVEVVDSGDENIFKVYIAQGNEKQRVLKFEVEGGQYQTVFIKVHDIFRREYEMYIPFKVNGLLGPPNSNSWSIELQYYIGAYKVPYENNTKVKLKSINKEIPYCRISGVITVPWIRFSEDKFEINYKPHAENTMEFTMANTSKYNLYVTIMISKLAPHFTLNLCANDKPSIISETSIKFELEKQTEVLFRLKFHPKSQGKFTTTALLYLDKHMTLPYHNLTFVGKKETPTLTASTYRIIFPPCHVGKTMSRTMNLTFEGKSNKDAFSCMSKEEPNLFISFINFEEFQEKGQIHTIVSVIIKVSCQISYARNLTLTFNHESGSGCDVEISFCFTFCPLTLHTTNLVTPEANPYPYFPLAPQIELYTYLNKSTEFLERWMFQQGFRRDLYPIIPDSFHAISSSISASSNATKSKGINVSYLNFIRRIAGPLMKHVRKITVTGVDEPFKSVKEIHDTYREIIHLLKSRGANLWILQAKFLLSYEQFVIYTENVTPMCNADIILNEELLADVDLFCRLNKQSWLDFILQSYKVFILDSCFFECICVSSQERDIVIILIEWYNEQIALQHGILRKNKTKRMITNITTDLSDGVAIISTILNYCTFLREHFFIFCEVDENDRKGVIINNACLIIEAINILRLNFPLQSTDFLEPNFIQMLFLSIHLYVTLPMFKTKDVIKFNPPLLRSSSRLVAISAASQESLTFNYIIINNSKNNFAVEKAPSGENGKKIFLSVKYIANFIHEETCILLVHGYNKTRIFDTYMIFVLQGNIGMLNPIRKCKVTGPLYRPNKVDVLVSSPFLMSASYQVYITDNEPTIPVKIEAIRRPIFYLRRLNLMDSEISLSGLPKDSGQEVQEHKLYLQMICLSTQTANSWIWFRSEIGEFFIKVTSQPRWDLAIDTLQARVQNWDPCSCGEACECYRTTILGIPHRNDLMLRALRYALLENASDIMMEVYDQLIETTTGKIILSMLLAEGGTNMSDVQHILRSETVYRISSRSFLPRLDKVKLAQHTEASLPLPITLPAQEQTEKYTVTLTSECGMDIRTYRVLFIGTTENK